MSPERRKPRIIPVLDVMNGRVVHAVGGLREKYQPIACPFTASLKPFDVAYALLQQSGANELYVADLDTILGTPRVSRAVQTLVEMCPVPTWLDAGIGRKLTAADLPALPHVQPVVGSETCGTPDVLRDAIGQAGGRPVAFSLDLKHGRLLGNWRNWELEGERDVLALARRVVGMGVRTLIVLDLARVGTGTGSGTEPLLKAVRDEFPEVELIAGGGVKTWADIDRLGEAGADAVLVASALHDGTLRFPRPSS
jgi:phosphoribosylformimino-5-aminoimidazole carboxamide ribotide isomerase